MSIPAVCSSSPSRLAALFLRSRCSHPEQPNMLAVTDVHSLSNPQQVRVTTVDLDLNVHFDKKILKRNRQCWALRRSMRTPTYLVLDTRKLQIDKAEISEDGTHWGETTSTRQRRSHSRFAAQHPDFSLGSLRPRHLSHQPERFRIAVAHTRTDRGQEAPLCLFAVRSHSCAKLDSDPGHAQRARDLQGPHPPPANAGGDERLQRAEASLKLGDFVFQLGNPIPSYLIALAVGRYLLQVRGPPHRRLCRAFGSECRRQRNSKTWAR